MKKLFLLLVVILTLSSCGAYGVQHQHDEFKQNDISYYALNHNVYSTLNANYYFVSFRFIKIQSKKDTLNKLYLDLKLKPNHILQDTLYIKVNNKIFKFGASEIVYNKKAQNKINTETTVVDEKNDEGETSQKTTTNVDVTNTEFTQTKALFLLSNEFINQLAQAEEFTLRFYDDDEPYSIKFDNYNINEIKEVYLKTDN